MIRMLVLGIVRAMLVAVWLLVATAIMLLLIGAMLLKALRVAPTSDDTAVAVTKIYEVIVAQVVKRRGMSGLVP